MVRKYFRFDKLEGFVIMALTYYHYTDSESLVRILKENLLRSSEGSGVSSHAADSVFFTRKVTSTSPSPATDGSLVEPLASLKSK